MPLLFRKEAAAYLTEKTGLTFKHESLSNLANSGRGPAYSHLAGRVVYEAAELDRWLEAQLAAKSPSARRRDRTPVPA